MFDPIVILTAGWKVGFCTTDEDLRHFLREKYQNYLVEAEAEVLVEVHLLDAFSAESIDIESLPKKTTSTPDQFQAVTKH